MSENTLPHHISIDGKMFTPPSAIGKKYDFLA
jgi:hypothetical protein